MVRGVGGYGNCVGVANVGGEVDFDAGLRDNPLVNAMCVGLLPADGCIGAPRAGAGNLVVLYGSRTGRDGIGGAQRAGLAGLRRGLGGEAARACRSATRSPARS